MGFDKAFGEGGGFSTTEKAPTILENWESIFSLFHGLDTRERSIFRAQILSSDTNREKG